MCIHTTFFGGRANKTWMDGAREVGKEAMKSHCDAMSDGCDGPETLASNGHFRVPAQPLQRIDVSM